MEVCNMSVKMNQEDMETLELLKDYYSRTLGIVQPNSSLMKTVMRDMLNQIKHIYFTTISNNTNLSRMAIDIKYKNKIIAQLLSDNCNTPIIALTIVDEIFKKIAYCRSRSEILLCIAKLRKTTGRFHIANANEIENDANPETYYGKMLLDISNKCVMVGNNYSFAQALNNYEVIARELTCMENESGSQELFKTYYIGEIIDFLNRMKCDAQGCIN